VKIAPLTVGPVQENTYIVVDEDSSAALLIDPGEEPERIVAALDELGASVAAILITHCHFDHIGAVAPLAKHTGAEVWVPKIERPLLADIMAYVPWPGIGEFESYDAEHDVGGGERLELAGFEIDVIFTPGHSPGHVTYSIPEHQVIFSGDVLFEGSIGRTDLPGGSMETLLESIDGLMKSLPAETTVCPGHMGITTLERERKSNPFLMSLR
jgi:glyoxylase-like metal-dependent hydrolase (beta-lactamase superfamily II)